MIDNCCKKLIKQGELKKHLLEDARQEGWIAYLEGNNILTHLTKWSRKEKRQDDINAELKKAVSGKMVRHKIEQSVCDDLGIVDTGFMKL